jgi:ABC-type uncharacterized transport system fused permease/ATPase subunit
LFLEEATSAFEPDSEQRVFEMLNRQLPDATLLTISVHPGLKSLHNRELVLTRMREAKFLFEGRRSNGRSHCNGVGNTQAITEIAPVASRG